MRPLRDWVYYEPEVASPESQGGILLIVGKVDDVWGRVAAVGPDVQDARVGDDIITEVGKSHPGITHPYRMVREKYVVAVVSNGEEESNG